MSLDTQPGRGRTDFPVWRGETYLLPAEVHAARCQGKRDLKDRVALARRNYVCGYLCLSSTVCTGGRQKKSQIQKRRFSIKRHGSPTTDLFEYIGFLASPGSKGALI